MLRKDNKGQDMDIFEIIELAKVSVYGMTWFSEKGPIHISKEGKLEPIKLKNLPIYQPERLSEKTPKGEAIV